jgi:hypothetical protein
MVVTMRAIQPIGIVRHRRVFDRGIQVGMPDDKREILAGANFPGALYVCATTKTIGRRASARFDKHRFGGVGPGVAQQLLHALRQQWTRGGGEGFLNRRAGKAHEALKGFAPLG